MPSTEAPAPEITTVSDPLLRQPSNYEDTADATATTDRASTLLRMFLGLFAGRRGASMIVRENVALQLEDWREDFGYSLPVVVFDTVWNFVFVVVTVVMLFWTAKEKPNVPVRVWIIGYSLQCVVHVFLAWKEYKRRNRRITIEESMNSSDSSGGFRFADDNDDYETTIGISTLIRPSRRWEKLNAMISYVWWVIGSIFMAASYKTLLHVAPRLFWLTLAFLAIDAFFTIIYVLMSCLVVLACFFCFPCILGFMYFIRPRKDGASVADISILPEFNFEMPIGLDGLEGRMVPTGRNGPEFSVERVLLTEDAACCICLCTYENGAKLHLLPCNHHFHAECIMKWLMVVATCPLCKKIIDRIQQV